MPDGGRGRFAGGDQAYLREVQYRDSSRLAQRANLHATYSTASTPWFEWVLEHARLRPRDRVLDAGCGAGWMWESAAAVLTGPVELTLSDLSPGMVAEAAERARRSGMVGEPTELRADLQQLPVTSDGYDRVFANHMLYHLPEPELGVAELARVVTTDGLVLITTNGRGHMRELWSLRSEVFGTDAVDPSVDAFGFETGFPVVRAHFSEIEHRRYDDVLRVTSEDDLVAYVCSTPPGETATAAERDELRRRIRAALESGGGELRVTKDTGCFVCRGPRSAT